MTDKLSVQTPGGDAATAADDVNAGRIAELEATVAQQAAMISQLNAEVSASATVPVVAAPVMGEKRYIGEDWSNKTAAEAKAAGVDRTVLCSDGYYVPGT